MPSSAKWPTLCDVLMRRARALYEARDGALLQAGALAADMGALLGWNDERMEREVAEYEKQVARARACRGGSTTGEGR